MAEIDLAESVEWYAVRKPGLEVEFIMEVDSTFQRIVANPLAFAEKYKRKNTWIRAAPLDRFPFMVLFIYNIQEELIIIIAVWHTARNPQKLRRRNA